MRRMEVVGSILGDDQGNQTMVPVGPKASWREGELAPGVMTPDEGLLVLPLEPLQNGGLFVAAVTAITFEGKQQKPFRAERFLTDPLRTGTSATGKLFAQIYVGTDLQQATTTLFDLELIAAPGAFGTRLTCTQAPPGVVTRIPIIVTPAPTGEDSILVSIIALGRTIH